VRKTAQIRSQEGNTKAPIDLPEGGCATPARFGAVISGGLSAGKAPSLVTCFQGSAGFWGWFIHG
jgi:hypothetical protein